ncbi:IS1096 element passenger TnpR family protein [Aquibacillus salsiterrae]|uniref:Plasmid pRiA4b ORF-3 family protein n=1 Tax=Aquibacillus salsiterrae TaxID=2950439 RepID=A0A9X3WII8_9BACI|nr:plasmid pRiA4b ORF-3 family protein [Aquibacillus salsiterrae]MDC3418094.1 plasmid pRiA4b ORF-3 family protein [Aquibacillus salsiterrae]
MEQLSMDSLFDDFCESKKDATSKTKQILINQQNGKSYPISLVRDFNEFIDYIEQHSVQITKTSEYISRKYLPMINERMSVKAEGVTAHSQQEYYPYIHFFYYIALAGRLVEKVSLNSTKPQLKVSERWNLFSKLTDTEKYLFMLETFWVDVNWSRLLDNKKNAVHHILPDIFGKLVGESLGSGIQLDENPLLSNLTFDWHHFFLYFEWFGIWNCEKDQERINHYGKKSYYFVKNILLSPFGEKVVPVLLESRNLEEWNLPLRREYGEVNPLPGSKLPEVEDPKTYSNEEENLPPFYQAFSDIFDKREIGNTIPRSERAYTPGVYTFKVAYDKYSWCKVVLSAKHTMNDLHDIIIRAFQLDDDHLYSFFMDGIKWSRECIVSPNDISGDTNAAETTIGSVGLRLGKRFLYLFDYGAEWTFTVTVKKMEETETEPLKPYISEKRGNGPEQYFWE